MKNRAIVALTLGTLMLAGCQESLSEKCARECRLYTQKNCPAQIDNHTILDSMTFEAESNTIHYYYTLTGVADSVGLLTRETVRNALKEQIRNTTMLQAYKEEGYNFAYTYHSQRRPQLVLIDETMTPKDY